MLKSVLGMAIVLAGLAMPAVAAPRPSAVPTAPATHQLWWTHAVIYEIYPRSFQDSNGDGVGDLNGVTQRLDYLKALGVDAIWLTPFYPSPNYDFGYDVADYTNVAPEYGTMADWDHLVAEARKRGIRVLVDFVLNHSSSEHPWFQQSRASRTNPKRDWYVWHDPAPDGGPPTNWQSIFGGSAWTLDKPTGQYYYHIFLPQQPDLNWRNPDLRKAMHAVMRFWLHHGASGFRLDATPYLLEDTKWPQDPDPMGGAPVGLKPYSAGLPGNHPIMRGLRAIVDRFPGDCILLGESNIASIGDLAKVYGAHQDEINLPMDFLYSGVRSLDAAVFKARIDDAETRLHGAPPVLFFSNHDRLRQASRFGDGAHDDQIARLTAAMTLALRGTALVYYGEELGMTDLSKDSLKSVPLGPTRKVADDRDPERTPMQWTEGTKAGFTTGAPWLPVNPTASAINARAEIADRASLYHWYHDLIGLRRTNPALREGAYVPLESGNPKVLAFARQDRRGRGVLVVLNMGDTVQQAHVTGWPGHAPVAPHTLLASPAIAAASLTDPALAPFGVQLIEFKVD
jgi:alpha-glucosidase